MKGIYEVQGMAKTEYAGSFAVPTGFDKNKFVSSWVKEGRSVTKQQQPEIILGTRYIAQGWEVYLEDGKPVKVAVEDGVYVLMYRPREVQNNVNTLYGNVSKSRANKEHSGETIRGVSPEGLGVLSAKTVDRLEGNPEGEEQEELFKEQPILEEGVGAKIKLKGRK